MSIPVVRVAKKKKCFEAKECVVIMAKTVK